MEWLKVRLINDRRWRLGAVALLGFVVLGIAAAVILSGGEDKPTDLATEAVEETAAATTTTADDTPPTSETTLARRSSSSTTGPKAPTTARAAEGLSGSTTLPLTTTTAGAPASTSTTEASTTTAGEADPTSTTEAPLATRPPTDTGGGGGVSVAVPGGAVNGPPPPSGSPLPPYTGLLGNLGLHEVGDRETGGPAPPRVGKGNGPLTGAPSSVGVRPALIVKIDNANSRARPQAALADADIVYEERVEGSVTRFAAVFHSKSPGVVGPVRSGRSTDIGIIDSFNKPIFAWSGANEVFAGLLRKQPIQDRGADVFSGYARSSSRRAPYNLFSNTDVLWSSAGGNGPPAHFAYRAPGQSPGAGAVGASNINVSFGGGSGSAPVSYSWNGAGWSRVQAGTAHVDDHGTQIAPENVVVQFVAYGDTGLRDVAGSVVPEAVLVGKGSAIVFTDGKAIPAAWYKPSLFAVTRFVDANGQLIKLTPGRTWVELVEPGAASYS